MDSNKLIEQIASWSGRQKELEAVCLVGSHARGQARPDSDIDLVILSTKPQVFLDDRDWLRAFGEVERSELEDWGAVKSIRTFYKDGAEIEFGIALSSWASIPLDPGTHEVLSDGMKILYDPKNILSRAAQAVTK